MKRRSKAQSSPKMAPDAILALKKAKCPYCKCTLQTRYMKLWDERWECANVQRCSTRSGKLWALHDEWSAEHQRLLDEAVQLVRESRDAPMRCNVDGIVITGTALREHEALKPE